MKLLVLLPLILVTSCGVSVHDCSVGTEGVDAAVSFYSEVIPEVTDILEIMCAPTERVQSSSSCGYGHTTEDKEQITSCLMFLGAGPYPARLLIDDSKDTAIHTCHELEHATPEAWADEDGCQSHDISCGYDESRVKRCINEVYESRGLDGG